MIILCQNEYSYDNIDACRKTKHLRLLEQSSASLRRSYSCTLGARTRGPRSFSIECNFIRAVVQLRSYRSIHGTAIPSPYLSAACVELLPVPTVVSVRDCSLADYAYQYMSPLQKLTMEHTEHAERLRFMNKRIIFGYWVHVRKKKKNYNPMFNER